MKPARIWILCGCVLLASCKKEHDKSSPNATGAPSSSGPVVASAPSASAAAVDVPQRPDRPLNVILLTIDSLRTDMPWTGYERPIAPNLTRLAERSVVYTHAYSVSSYTAKSVGVMMTGKYPSSLYRSGWFFTGYSDANVFFTEPAQAQGIRTIGIHGHMYFGRGKNLNQGFDVWELVPGISFDAQTDNHVTSDKMTDLAIELLGKPENTSKQFFAWLHYMDPHDKYVLHEEAPDWGKTNRDRYDSEIFYTDLHVGRLLDWAAKQDFFKDTVVIISADHGEAFGEHGMYKHAFRLWEVLTRVPLIVSGAGIEPRRIDARRSQIDLAPTISDLLRLKNPPDGFEGKSLVPEIYGLTKPDDREPILLDLPEDSHNPPVLAIISGDYKLIVSGPGHQLELFNLAKDPDENTDLSKSKPEKLKELKALLDKRWSSIPTIAPFGGMKLREGRTANGPTAPP